MTNVSTKTGGPFPPVTSSDTFSLADQELGRVAAGAQRLLLGRVVLLMAASEGGVAMVMGV